MKVFQMTILDAALVGNGLISKLQYPARRKNLAGFYYAPIYIRPQGRFYPFPPLPAFILYCVFCYLHFFISEWYNID